MVCRHPLLLVTTKDSHRPARMLRLQSTGSNLLLNHSHHLPNSSMATRAPLPWYPLLLRHGLQLPPFQVQQTRSVLTRVIR